MVRALGLDEALIKVNQTRIEGPLEIYYQFSECFGCPMEKLTTLTHLGDLEFVVPTKDELRLELKQANQNQQMPASTICKLNKLSLSDHSQYTIHLNDNNQQKEFDCELIEDVKGPCYLCPIFMLLGSLVAISLLEILIIRLWMRRKSFYHSKISEMRNEIKIDDTEEHNSSEAQEVISSCSLEAPDTILQDENTEGPRRVDALDIFRGLTITGMIMVNYGGAGYTFLEHKTWDGLELADFVFPFFIFSMGASISIALKSAFRRGTSMSSMIVKILIRSEALMILGICLNSKWLNDRGFEHLRLTGVLQRFSISYLMVATIYTLELSINNWAKSENRSRFKIILKIIGYLIEVLTASLWLSVYVYFSFYFKFNDECPAGYLGPGGQTENGLHMNCTGGAAAWLDRRILGEGHMYNDTSLSAIYKTNIPHDPEGLLGFTTSIILTMVGLQCGKILTHSRHRKVHRMRLIMLSQWLLLLTLASGLIVIVPINKKLWSITFVTATGASAYLSVLCLYILFDILKCHKVFIVKLIESAGKNPILLYVGHSLIYGMLPWYVAVDQTSHGQLLARLVWSTFVWLWIAYRLDMKKLYLKI